MMNEYEQALAKNTVERLEMLESTNAALLELLKNLTRWVGKGIADGAYSECVNSERAMVDLERANEAIRKATE